MPSDPRRRLAVFLHDASYDRIHQGCAIAATAAAMGRDVQLFLFWWALDRFLEDGFATPDIIGPQGRERAGQVASDSFEKGVPTAADLLRAARSTGHCTLYACSASAQTLGRRPDEVARAVDLVVGWTSILSLTEGVADRFYL